MPRTLSRNSGQLLSSIRIHCGQLLTAWSGIVSLTMIETSARLLALLSLLQMRREWAGSGARRSARGGPADDPPRHRQAALARLSDRVRPRGGRGLPPRLRRPAAAAPARGRRGRRRRRRLAHRGGGVDRRHRGDLGTRAGQARAGAPEPPAPPGARARRCHLGASTFEGPRIDADLLSGVAGACRDQHTPALRLCGQGRARQPARHRSDRARAQRPALVPGRLRPRPRGLAHVSPGSDSRPRPSGRARTAARRARVEIPPPMYAVSCARRRRRRERGAAGADPGDAGRRARAPAHPRSLRHRGARR